MNTEKDETANHSSSDEHGRFSGLYIIAFAVLMGLYFFQLWFHATRTSPTFDEGVHLLAGYRNWQCGDFGGTGFGHPPLLKLLAAAPLNFQPVVEPDWNWDCGSRILSRGEGFFSGPCFWRKMEWAE